MIQIHDKKILSMEFKSIIKAFKLMAIYLTKAQFLLAISKPSSRWQYLKPNFHWQH